MLERNPMAEVLFFFWFVKGCLEAKTTFSILVREQANRTKRNISQVI